MQEDCQPLSLKALFRATQKVFPNTSWDGTMQQTQLPASQSNSPFQDQFRKSNTLWEGTSSYLLAPATTSLQRQLPLLYRRPLPYRSSYQFCTSSGQSCTSDHLPAPTDTSGHLPAPADTSNWQSWTSDHSPAPVDTSNYQSWANDHFPAPADASNYQSWTSNHFPAPVDTSNYQFWTSEYLPAPAYTSPKPATT